MNQSVASIDRGYHTTHRPAPAPLFADTRPGFLDWGCGGNSERYCRGGLRHVDAAHGSKAPAVSTVVAAGAMVAQSKSAM